MILDILNKLIVAKYDGYRVYVHNLSNFDALFILDILNRHFSVNIIRNKGPLWVISIKVSKAIKIVECGKEKSKVITLTFYDSYQLLPSSLRKLAIALNANIQKDIFPHNFVNIDTLNYIGRYASTSNRIFP